MYIRTMLSTQALLSAIGVGEKSATVIGATFQGSNLDSNAKMWRLVADLMNDLGRKPGNCSHNDHHGFGNACCSYYHWTPASHLVYFFISDLVSYIC
ncbi:protein root UVB sensitive 3-like isoform X3 [Lotus japonicus]|nr:protein root UVB sensitive 3-like isoform X3 [Lotus japonicus]